MSSAGQQVVRHGGISASRAGYLHAETAQEYPQASYYRARYYDSKAGRFLSEDPIGFSSGLDFYTYTGNRPTGFTDPSGKCTNGIDTVICIVAGVGAVVIYTTYLDFDTSLRNLENLLQNYNAAWQNVLRKCTVGPYSAEACQKAIDTAAQAECAYLRGAQKAAFAGALMPLTSMGGDVPSSKWDLVNSALSDQITRAAEEKLHKSKKYGCGCQ